MLTLQELVATYADESDTVEYLDGGTRAFVTTPSGIGYHLNPANYGVVVVLGAGYWGAGPNLTDAKRQYRRHGGMLNKGYVILTFPPESLFLGVDGMGRVSWFGEPPAEKVVQPRSKS